MVRVRRSEEKWIGLYQQLGAYWEYSGNPKQPHVILSSGAHSNGFFNSGQVLKNPTLAHDIAYDLWRKARNEGLDAEMPDWIAGPAMGAVALVDMLGLVISRRGRTCMVAYAEKNYDLPGHPLYFKRPDMRPGDRVLVCEDVSTRLESIGVTAREVEKARATVLPYYLMIVNRSGKTHVQGRKIISLVVRNFLQWDPEECPLCKAGSVPLRPKGKEEWARLTATY